MGINGQWEGGCQQVQILGLNENKTRTCMCMNCVTGCAMENNQKGVDNTNELGMVIDPKPNQDPKRTHERK